MSKGAIVSGVFLTWRTIFDILDGVDGDPRNAFEELGPFKREHPVPVMDGQLALF